MTEKTYWNDRVKNTQLLQDAKEKRNILLSRNQNCSRWGRNGIL